MRRHPFHNDDDQRDALNDYLDSHTGFAPAGSRADDLDVDLRDGIERFLDLAERAGAIPGGHSQHRRPAMNATLPASGTVAAPNQQTRKRTRPSLTLPAWTRHLHMLSTVLLIAAVAALSVIAFGPNGIGGGNGGTGDGPGFYSAVPVATVPDDAVTSSIPYPTADECTVEPMTRNQLIQHYQDANVATMPDLPSYERHIEPSAQEAEAIMHVFRQDQACGQSGAGGGPEYTLQFQTPWHTANSSPPFLGAEGVAERPISDDQIEDYVDALLADRLYGATPVPAIGTPPPMPTQPVGVPIPDNATPVVYEGGGSFPTIFAEDIVMTGPDSATARAYFVNEETWEVMPSTPLTYKFVNIDGQWLINYYREGRGG